MDQRDWLFMVEAVFLYGGLMAFGLWQVWKMKRDLAEIRAKKAAKAAEQTDTPSNKPKQTREQATGPSAEGDCAHSAKTDTKV